jgi:tetratricopeptide (TPR) repeat protein
MLDSEVYGTNSGGYHLTNLWLHIAAILTLFFTLNRLTRALWRSAVVAALFAWHPLHVESVAWVAERKGLLSTVFGLLALWAYARYAEGRTVRDGAPGAEQEKRGSRYSKSRDSTAKTSADYRERHMDSSPRPGLWYALALLFFLFSLMSKPMLVTLPAVLLLVDLWPLRRIHFSAGSLQSKALLNLLREKLPFFVLSIAAAALAFWIQQKRGNLGGLDNYPFELRSANALTSYVRYLGKLVWPTRLAPFYPYPSEGMIGPTAAGGVLLLTVTWITLRSVRGAPYLAVGWLWFLVTLLPVIGWVQVGAHSMADRYTYVPMIGLFLLAIWALGDLALRYSRIKIPVRVMASVCLVACMLLSDRQVRYWQNSGTLFRHTIDVMPRNYLAYNNLGLYLADAGRPAEALNNYQASIAIKNAWQPHDNAGLLLVGEGRFTEALSEFESALKLYPDSPSVRCHLADGLSRVGRLDEAVAHYHLVLQAHPADLPARSGLGIALSLQGKFAEAEVQFAEVLRTDPNNSRAHGNLGNALVGQNKIPAATEEFRQCVRLDPEDPQARLGLGRGLLEQHNFPEAIEQFKYALRLNPTGPELHFYLALALERQGMPEEALPHLHEALRLKPDYAQAQELLDGLGRGRRTP